MEFTKIGALPMTAFGTGAVLAFLVPIAVAAIWIIKKKEPFTTVLIGTAAFILFAIALEKPIQNMVIDTSGAFGRFLEGRPILWALVVGLFPGVFEETGRLVAYKTVLKNRKNRETAISYGIGHGGMEVMLVLGASYITDLVYSVMVNTGAFGTVVNAVAAETPELLETITAIPAQLAAFSFGTLGLALFERLSAVLFHIGASILVFYACKDKFWLYPLAILLHTAMDFFAGLLMVGVFNPPIWVFEMIIAAIAASVFLAAYFGLYKKDTPEFEQEYEKISDNT